MQEKCSKCDSEELFVEIQGNRRGLYCGNCGKWQKWITKQESYQNVKNVQIMLY